MSNWSHVEQRAVMCQPAVPIEARVCMSRFKILVENRRKQVQHPANASLLCKQAKLLCQPVSSSLSYTAVMYLLQALLSVTIEARQCLATQITCCKHVNMLSGVQDMHSSLCGHSLDWRNKARGLVSRRARGNCRQNAVAATGFTGLHPL